jgi:hypothetical protein
MPTPMNLDFDALATNPFGLALACGRLKATITDAASGEHLTVQFKTWKRGDRRRNIPLSEAERVYISVPNAHDWRGDRVGNIDLTSGTLWEDANADPQRVAKAMNILAVAQGQIITDRVQHPGSCMICGKELTDPQSIDRGIGPDCYQNATNSIHQTKEKPLKSRQGDTAPPVEVAADKPHVTVASDDKHYGVNFQAKYSKVALDIFKGNTDWKGRQYDSHTKIWWVTRTPQNAKAILSLIALAGLNATPEAIADLNEMAQIEVTDAIIGVDEADITVAFDFGPSFDGIKSILQGIETRRKFDGISKLWRVEPTKQAAIALARLCKEYKVEVSEDAANILKPLRQQGELDIKNSSLKASLSTAEDADLDLDGFGFEPMPFQRAGIVYGDYAHDRYMIADEQGLGKTIQALGRIAARQSFPAVVVTPSAVKVKWARAAEKALPGRTVAILEGTKPSKIDADVIVVNYEILSPWSGAIISAEPRALVLDESHYIKNPKAQRNIAAKAISESVRQRDGLVLLTTGTPVLNRPIELVEQLDVMGRLNDFGGFSGFVTNYVGWETVEHGPKRGSSVPARNGAKNLTALNERLRQTCYVRRLKRDVLPELPEKRREVVPMAIDQPAYLRAVEKARRELREAGNRAEQIVIIQKLRKLTAEFKMESAKKWVADFLETGEKLVLFAHHRDIQQGLLDAFPDALRISGSQDQPKKARQEAMDRFQNDPEAKLIVCSMSAAREGIDLFAASNLAFMELGWNPAIHDQAEDRIHRIGQDRGTMMSYLLAEGTMDEPMGDLIERKRKVKDAATEGGAVLDEPENDMIDTLMDWLTKDEND